VSEEELEALFHHVGGEQASGWRESRASRLRAHAVHSALDLGRKTGLALFLLQLVDNLGPGALGALLLRDRIVGTRQLRSRAIAAWIDAITFDLATMASVASPLDGGRHDRGSGSADRSPENRSTGGAMASRSHGADIRDP